MNCSGVAVVFSCRRIVDMYPPWSVSLTLAIANPPQTRPEVDCSMTKMRALQLSRAAGPLEMVERPSVS